MSDIIDVTSRLIVSHPDLAESILAWRINTFSDPKIFTMDDNLNILEIVGSVEVILDGKCYDLLVNFTLTDTKTDELRYFKFYTTSISLAWSIYCRLNENEEDTYNPDYDTVISYPRNNISLSDIDPATLYYDSVSIQPVDAIADWRLNYELGSCIENIVRFSISRDLYHLDIAKLFLDRECQKFENQ